MALVAADGWLERGLGYYRPPKPTALLIERCDALHAPCLHLLQPLHRVAAGDDRAELGRPEVAAEHHERALQLDPRDARPSTALRWCGSGSSGTQRRSTCIDGWSRSFPTTRRPTPTWAPAERRYVTSCGPSHAVLIVLALLPVARITYRPCRRRVARPRFIGLGERETLKSAVAPGSRSALRLFAAVDAGRCGSAGPRAGAYHHRLAQTLQETFQLGRRPFLGPHPVVKSPHPIIDSADIATQLTPNVMQLVAYPADVTAQLVPDAVQLAAYSATCFYGARCRCASIQEHARLAVCVFAAGPSPSP